MDQYDFVCITLESRPDRRHNSEELFKKLGILDRIHWWSVQKHPQGGMYGCFESHWLVWNCEQFKKPYLCVFEDDLILDDPFRFYQHLLTAQEYMPSRFDIINLEPGLGFQQHWIDRELYSGGFLHLGSYLVARDSIPNISKRTRKWFGIDIDTALYKNCRMAGVFPPIFKQIPNDSENGGGYRGINLPLEHIWNNFSKMYEYFPGLGWIGLEMAQLLSLYYVMTRNREIEFLDRRIDDI